jgi:hypothetical protein
MKILIPTLLLLVLAGVLGGCAGRGYGEASYGGVYSSYHPFASDYFFYGYPYSGYYAGYHYGFRSRPFIIHPRSSLKHDRRMIIDGRHSNRHFLYDHHRRGHDRPSVRGGSPHRRFDRHWGDGRRHDLRCIGPRC